MTGTSEQPDDAVDLPDRRATPPDEAHIAGIVRQAVTAPAATAGRPRQLAQAALARAQRRRHRRLLGSSAVLVAAATLAAFGVSTDAPWSPSPVNHFAADDTSSEAPTAAATPAPTPSASLILAPMPTPTETPASALTYLTPAEVHAVFPDADSLDPNGEFQWADVQGHTWFTACGGDTTLEGIAPLYSMQIASWGQSTPQPPDPTDGQNYNLITQDVNVNMFIFSAASEAEHFGDAFAASLATCTADPASDLHPSAPVSGLLDTGAASLFTYGYYEGKWQINALAVRGRYAAMTWAQVPAAETDQGYVDAARATAGLALIAAQRADAANLP